jgi:hypothetical protein
MTPSREFLAFGGYVVGLMFIGSTVSETYSIAPDYAFMGGFAIAAVALEPVRDRLQERELSRREPHDDARAVDGCGDA